MAILDFGITVATAPAVEPIDLQTAKRWLRVLHNDDDQVLTDLIVEARETVERDARKSLITQTVDLFLDEWPGWEIELFRSPVQSVTWIKYYDADNTQQTWSSSNYQVDTVRGYVFPLYTATYPTHYTKQQAINVRYVAGFGDTGGSVPQGLKTAMLLQLGTLYTNRTAAPMDKRSGVDDTAYWGLIARHKTRTYP